MRRVPAANAQALKAARQAAETARSQQETRSPKPAPPPAQFIALLSGILLFSVNFSDKQVKAESAPVYYKHILVSSWSCFIFSIIGCCLAMALAWTAARRMLWGEPNDATKSNALS